MGSCITKDNYFSPVFTYIPPKNNSTISYITYASCTSIGYRHMKNENQDRGGVSLNPGGGGTRFVAFVFDGHGEFGSAVVEYALEEFPEILHKHIQLSSVRPQLYIPQKEVINRQESYSSTGDYSSISQKYVNRDSNCRLSSKLNHSTQILPIGNNTIINPLQSTTITVLPYPLPTPTPPPPPPQQQQQQIPNTPLSNTSSATLIKIDKTKKVERSNSFDNNNNNNNNHNESNSNNSNFSSMNYITKLNKKNTLHDYESSGEYANRKYKESHRYLSLDHVLHQSSGKYIKNVYETSSNGLSNNLTNQSLSPNASTINLNSDINIANNNNNNNDNSINGDILCEIMKHSFLDLHNNMIENSSETCSLEMSGCTATSIMIEGNILISSNVGDSRALLCRRNNENKYFGIQITTDHRVSMPKERIRIEECGGCVFKAPHRGLKGEDRMWVKDCLYPGLMVSRSLGDTIAHEIGDITMPDTVKMELTMNDDLIILGSDGLWDMLDNDKVIEMINNLKNQEVDASVYCKELLKSSLDGWKEMNASDNIYITVIMLHHNSLS